MRLLNDDQISTSRNTMRSFAMQDKTEIVRPLVPEIVLEGA
jgi:hypothetical protein